MLTITGCRQRFILSLHYLGFLLFGVFVYFVFIYLLVYAQRHLKAHSLTYNVYMVEP